MSHHELVVEIDELINLPNGTVLLDYEGRAAQIYFWDDEDREVDDPVCLRFAGTDHDIDLNNDIGAEDRLEEVTPLRVLWRPEW